jgi:hypothetical protein
MAAASVARGFLALVGRRRVLLSLACVCGGRPWNDIATVEPAAEVDVPATHRAERERWQVIQPGDREGLAADRAPALDHHADPLLELAEEVDLEGAGAALAAAGLESLFGESFLPEEDGSDDDFSAFAAFLYESLR